MKKLILFLILLSLPAWGKDVTLQWNCTDNCGWFRIYRSQGSSDWPEYIGAVHYPTMEFTDVNIPHGDISYVVTYCNGIESNASNEVELAYYYPLTRYDYDTSGRILYKGENSDISASDSDADWVISKYYYNASGSLIEIRVRTTSWTNRASGW